MAEGVSMWQCSPGTGHPWSLASTVLSPRVTWHPGTATSHLLGGFTDVSPLVLSPRVTHSWSRGEDAADISLV